MIAAVAVVAALAVAPSAGAAPNPAKAWCALKPGASRTALVDALGKPNPTKQQTLGNKLWTKYGGAPLKTIQWNLDGDIFLATFGKTWASSTNLQAYYAPLAPLPARNLSCHAFRNVNGVSSN